VVIDARAAHIDRREVIALINQGFGQLDEVGGGGIPCRDLLVLFHLRFAHRTCLETQERE